MTLAIPWNDNSIGRIYRLLFAALAFEPKKEAGADEGANETAARLMDQYGDSILRFAYAYLHNMSDAEEILQDTLLAYLVNKPAFANEAHAKAWLFRVAGNLSKNRIRYNGYRNHDELMEELVAEEKEDLRFVWEAVSQLPDNYREVIHLFYREGFTTAEIAAILGRREVTVRSDLSRARKKLKEISSADPERLAAYKIDADEDLPKAFSGRKRYPASKILAGLAVACAIILIAGIIRFSLPVMSPSTAGSTSYEEATEFSAEGAEADTIVGNQDTGGQTALQNSEKTDEAATNGVAEAEDGGAAGAAADRTEDAAEDSTSDRVDMPVQLSEPEIRKIVENYIGSEFVISDTTAEEDTLIYTVSDVQTGDVFSYIRIHVSDGSVEIENAETKEISALTFRDLMGQ